MAGVYTKRCLFFCPMLHTMQRLKQMGKLCPALRRQHESQ